MGGSKSSKKKATLTQEVNSRRQRMRQRAEVHQREESKERGEEEENNKGKMVLTKELFFPTEPENKILGCSSDFIFLKNEELKFQRKTNSGEPNKGKEQFRNPLPVEVHFLPTSCEPNMALVYKPPRNGATLWDIGIADRTAAEFFIPKPDPKYKVYPFKDQPENRFREYGMWKRYADLYPDGDLVFTVGSSDYAKDWFFAHVTRELANGTYEDTTRQIVFKLENVNTTSYYTLRLALAAVHLADVQLRFNKRDAELPHFSTGIIGGDNAVARHGIHGLYWLFSFRVSGSWLVPGNNTIFLTHVGGSTSWRGAMYDYIRFEGPDQLKVSM